MKLYLLRHGETDWNKERRLQGQSDIPLNEYGVELAVRTAEGLRQTHFDAIFSSPLQRAFVTAQIVAENRGIPVVTDDRLVEIHFGEDEGKFFEDGKKNPQHSLYRLFHQPEEYAPTGGETLVQAKQRAMSFFEEKILPCEKSCESVLIVAHGGWNRCLINTAAGIPNSEFWNIALPNCAVSELALEEGRLRLIEVSRTYYDTPINGKP